jgi:electron transport complex protein RnfB
MLAGVIAIGLIALVAGALLAWLQDRLPGRDDDLVETVDALLPQTQCAQCGYPGCRPYARAIADEGAAINLCPPGGDVTVRRLAELLGREALPLASPAPAPQVAVIDESRCIGCLHCRSACPVDAIVGAQSLMHTVIETECTGCELCLAPCPVDCIDLRRIV